MGHWRGFLLWGVLQWNWQCWRSAVPLAINRVVRYDNIYWRIGKYQAWLYWEAGPTVCFKLAHSLDEQDFKSHCTGVTVLIIVIPPPPSCEDTSNLQAASDSFRCLSVAENFIVVFLLTHKSCGFVWQVNSAAGENDWVQAKDQLCSVDLPVGLSGSVGASGGTSSSMKRAHSITRDRCSAEFLLLLAIKEGRKM